MAFRPSEGAEELVVVHLSDVPEKQRVAAAERIIKGEALDHVHPEDAILLRMAALFPRQDPCLEVPRSVARAKGVRL